MLPAIALLEEFRADRIFVDGVVAGDDGHAVDEGCGGDERITLGTRCRHMQSCASPSDFRVNWKYALTKCWEHMTLQPYSQCGPLGRVAALRLKRA